MTLFELMDIEAGSVVGFYPSEEDALAVVRRSLERYGAASVLTLALSGGTEQEVTDLIAEGEDLLRLARGGAVKRVTPFGRSHSTQAGGVAGAGTATETVTGIGIRKLAGANWLRSAFGQPSRTEPQTIGHAS